MVPHVAARKTAAALKIFVRYPKKTFATISETKRETFAHVETYRSRPYNLHLLAAAWFIIAVTLGIVVARAVFGGGRITYHRVVGAILLYLLIAVTFATLFAFVGLSIPVIGIGAGVGCSGQVLVLHDMLGLTGAEPLRFVRNFLDGSAGIEAAVRRYVADVKGGLFPDDALHGF